MMPLWSKDGKRLYFQDADQRLNAVEIKIEKGSVQTGTRTTLFSSNLPSSYDESGYDTTRDGRFLMIKYSTESSAPMTWVTNWNAELRK